MRYSLAGCFVLALAVFTSVRADEPASPGKLITLEVVVADVPSGAAATPTAAAILDMEKAGKLSACSRFRLTGLENQETSIQFGEHVPIVTGRTIRGGGGPGGAGGFPGIASFTNVSVGTLVETVSRVESAEAVVISLKLQRSSVTPAAPAAEAADPNTPPQGTTTLNMQATVRAKPGEPLLVSGRQLSIGKETTQTWVVVTASVGAGAAPEKKAAAAALDGDQLKIVQLKHAAAPALANVLVGVFQREPLRISVDERTNSLLLRGSANSLEIVVALIARLDEA